MEIQERQKGLATVVTILLVVLLAGGLGAGAYFGYNYWVKQANKDVGLNETPPPTPPDPRAGWETYTDATNGFSLKYPPTWTTKEGTFPSTHGTTVKDVSFTGSAAKDKVFVTVRTNPDADLKTFVEKDSVTDIKPAKVDSLDGFAGVTTDSYRVYLGKDTKVYMFTFPGAKTDKDLSTDQVNVLTSFEFASATSTTPSSPSATPAASGVTVSSLTPTSGTVGAAVTIKGSGFVKELGASTGNTVQFGTDKSNLSGYDGSDYLVSSDGTTLKFIVPATYKSCGSDGTCKDADVAAGTYYVSVKNTTGESGSLTFTVTQ